MRKRLNLKTFPLGSNEHHLLLVELFKVLTPGCDHTNSFNRIEPNQDLTMTIQTKMFCVCTLFSHAFTTFPLRDIMQCKKTSFPFFFSPTFSKCCALSTYISIWREYLINILTSDMRARLSALWHFHSNTFVHFMFEFKFYLCTQFIIRFWTC